MGRKNNFSKDKSYWQNMVDRENGKEFKSDEYQYKFYEIQFEQKDLIKLSNGIPISPEYNDKIQEKLDELKILLINRMWQIVEENCTKKQIDVLKLYYKEGMTQVEVAKKLNLTQHTITKSISGNAIYGNGKGKKPTKVLGGSIRKLKLILGNDPISNDLLKRMQLIEDEIADIYPDFTTKSRRVNATIGSNWKIVNGKRVYYIKGDE